MGADVSHNLEATVFVYRHKETRQIQCEYIDRAKLLQDAPEWEHLATLEPRMWIQCHWDAAIAKGHS